MKENERIQAENYKKAHYFFIGKDYNKIIDKLNKNMPYHRIAYERDFNGREIVYDVKSNMLSKAGIVISKQYEEGQSFFKVRKISSLTGGYKRPSQKFELGQCESTEAPKDFPTQIANAVSNAFSNAFTIDLVSVVRQTLPKIEIVVTGKRFRVVSGNGYNCTLLYETAIYKDLETNKKVKRNGFTLHLPKGEKYEKDNKIVIEAIDHYCKELVYYQESRFEIADRLLHPKPVIIEEKQEEE